MNLDLNLCRQGPFSVDLSREAGREAKRAYRAFRVEAGWADNPSAKLLTAPSENLKLAKSEATSYGLSLAPHRISGNNVCSKSTPECRRGCLSQNGNGAYPQTIAGRITKTEFLAAEPQNFVNLLAAEIMRAVKREGSVKIRLNVYSDLRWELFAPELFDIEGATFYDYTKWAPSERPTSAVYDLTYSVSERVSEREVSIRGLAGVRQAVVFSTRKGDALPSSYAGLPVVDGDLSDDRTLDPAGAIVGLRAKGRLRKLSTPSATGFVRVPS